MSHFSLSKDEKLSLGLGLLGVFIASLNQTILSPALPSIMRTMGITASQGQWFTTIFLLTNGIMIPITAYLTERFRFRQLYLTAMAIFTAGTLLAGVSSQFWQLAAARVLQGMAFGILMPLIINFVMAIFPSHKRGVAMGYVGIIFSAAPAVGPPLAGLVIDSYGWNRMFLVLVPFLLGDILLSLVIMPKGGKTSRPVLDIPSIFLSSLGFGALLYAFSISGTRGWLSPIVIGGTAFGLVVTWLFLRRQERIDHPLLRVDVFSQRQFSIGTFLSMLVNAGMIAGTIATPIYLQQVLGYSAFKSSLVMLPAFIFSIFASPAIGSFFDRRGLRGLAITGFIVQLAATLLFLTFTAESPFWYLSMIYTARVVGITLVMSPLNTWSLNALPQQLISHGNAFSATLRQVAASLGTAVIISIMTMVTMANSNLGTTLATLKGFHMAFLGNAALIAVALVMVIAQVKKEDVIR
ncbi:MDR family MFS transporter [Peptococcus simiae]|uniref:MDR family MFS transporter n=1 Tax=Peptococcus simiae TaxID=1643805 RepID=A0ABW9GVF3_9FIRM